MPLSSLFVWHTCKENTGLRCLECSSNLVNAVTLLLGYFFLQVQRIFPFWGTSQILAGAARLSMLRCFIHSCKCSASFINEVLHKILQVKRFLFLTYFIDSSFLQVQCSTVDWLLRGRIFPLFEFFRDFLKWNVFSFFWVSWMRWGVRSSKSLFLTWL